MANTAAEALEAYAAHPDRRGYCEPWMLRFARSVSSPKQWQTIRKTHLWFIDHVDFRGAPGFFNDDDWSSERIAWGLLGGDAGERWAAKAVAAGPAEDGDGFAFDDDLVLAEADSAAVGFDPDTAATELVSGQWADANVFAAFEGRKPEWVGVMCFEGVMTADNRWIAPGALVWRKLPFTLQDQLLSDDGHDGATAVGPIVSLERVTSQQVSDLTGGHIDIPTDANGIWGAGLFDTGEEGAAARRRMAEGTKQGVSVDLTEVVLDLPDDPDEAAEVLFGGGVLRIVSAKIGAATLVAIPAFEDARLTIAGDIPDSVDPGVLVASGGLLDGVTLTVTAGVPLTAVGVDYEVSQSQSSLGYSTEHLDALLASGSPVRPPSMWFGPVDYMEPQPLVVEQPSTNHGGLRRIHGHLGLKGSCHIGFTDRCVDVPTGLDYDSFQGDRAAGIVRCSDGPTVHAGPIVMSTDHADIRDARGRTVPAGTAIDHYAHTGCLVAQGRCYEDRWGVYVNGWVLPDVTDSQLARLDACDLSPDWRPRATASGGQGVVALLTVPVSGFNTALAASAGISDRRPVDVVELEAWETYRDNAARKAAALQAVDQPVPAGVAAASLLTGPPEDQARKARALAALNGGECSCGCRGCGQ